MANWLYPKKKLAFSYLHGRRQFWCRTGQIFPRGRENKHFLESLRSALNLEDSRKCLLFLRTVVLGIKTSPSSWFKSLEVPSSWAPPLGSGVRPVWASTPEPSPALFPRPQMLFPCFWFSNAYSPLISTHDAPPPGSLPWLSPTRSNPPLDTLLPLPCVAPSHVCGTSVCIIIRFMSGHLLDCKPL